MAPFTLISNQRLKTGLRPYTATASWLIRDSAFRALKTSKMTLPRIYIGENTATKVSVSWSIYLSKVKAAFLAYVCNDASDRIEGSREGAMPTRILRTCWRGGAFAWLAGSGCRRFP